jgi:hypothetical protein
MNDWHQEGPVGRKGKAARGDTGGEKVKAEKVGFKETQ